MFSHSDIHQSYNMLKCMIKTLYNLWLKRCFRAYCDDYVNWNAAGCATNGFSRFFYLWIIQRILWYCRRFIMFQQTSFHSHKMTCYHKTYSVDMALVYILKFLAWNCHKIFIFDIDLANKQVDYSPALQIFMLRRSDINKYINYLTFKHGKLD